MPSWKPADTELMGRDCRVYVKDFLIGFNRFLLPIKFIIEDSDNAYTACGLSPLISHYLQQVKTIVFQEL